MTEPINPHPTGQPAGPSPMEPFHTAIEGQPTVGEEWEWANTVTVEVVTTYMPGVDGDPPDDEPDEARYADGGGVRQLVRVDTNYKPSRPGAAG